MQSNFDPAQARATLEQTRPFFLWFNQRVLATKISKISKAFEAFGWGLGGISTYSSYVLSASFGGLLAVKMGAGAVLNTIFEIVFGVMDAVPLTALLAPMSQEIFKEMADTLEGKAALPERKDKRWLRRLIKGIEGFFSTTGFTPFFGVNLGSIVGGARLPLSYLAIPASYLGLRKVQRQLFFKYLNERLKEPSNVKEARSTLSTRLVRSRLVLPHMNNNEVDAQYAQLRAHQNDNLDSLLFCFNLLLSLSTLNNVPQTAAHEYSRLRNYLLSSIAVTISIGILLSTFYDTQTISDGVLDTVGENNPDTQQNFSYFFAFLAFLPNVFFIAFFTKLFLDNVVDAVLAKNCRPSGRDSSAFLIASGSATAYVYLSLTGYTGFLQYYLVATSYLGPTMVRTGSLSAWLARILPNIDSLRGVDSPRLKRMLFGDMLGSVGTAIDTMDGGLALAVHQALSQSLAPAAPQASPLQLIESSQEASVVFFHHSPSEEPSQPASAEEVVEMTMESKI